MSIGPTTGELRRELAMEHAVMMAKIRDDGASTETVLSDAKAIDAFLKNGDQE